MSIKVILAAGGSGGHIFPSIALSEELAAAGVKDVFFVSSRRRLDRELLKEAGGKCFFLSVNPMPMRLNPFKLVVFAWKVLADTIRSLYIVLRISPDVVVGFGGYSSGTITAIASILGIPVMIHEQNLFPGRANRILSRMADRIAVSFKGTEEYFACRKDKVVYSGNPLRSGLLSIDRENASEYFGMDPKIVTVLVMGGSQGSSFLNSTVSRAALSLKKRMDGGIQFIHITGKKDYDEIKMFYEEGGIKSAVYPFLKRIDRAYAACDMAISRSGAAAVFELALYARPMILVPYPHPKSNQRYNAMYFAENGAAIYREEDDLTPEDIASEIYAMLDDKDKLAEASRAAKGLSMPDASSRLAGEVIALAKTKKEKGRR